MQTPTTLPKPRAAPSDYVTLPKPKAAHSDYVTLPKPKAAPSAYAIFAKEARVKIRKSDPALPGEVTRQV